MTLLRREIPESPFLRPVVGDRLGVSLGEQFGASLGLETAVELVGRQARIERAEDPLQGVPAPLRGSAAETFQREGPPAPKIHPEELNRRYRNLGLNFTRPMTEEAADVVAMGKRAELIRQDIISRGPGGVLGVGATLAGGLIATAIDPLELATAFVPVVGQARLAGMIARMGRVGGRTAAGAIEGAVGNVLTEPLFFTLSRQQQLDYGMADAALNVFLGSALGTLGGAARGLAGRQVRVQAANEPPFDVPVQPMRPRPSEAVRRMSNEDRLAAHRAALAQIAQGRSVDMSAITLRGTTALSRAGGDALAGFEPRVESGAVAAPVRQEPNIVLSTKPNGETVFGTRRLARRHMQRRGVEGEIVEVEGGFSVQREVSGDLRRGADGEPVTFRTEREAGKFLSRLRSDLRPENAEVVPVEIDGRRRFTILEGGDKADVEDFRRNPRGAVIARRRETQDAQQTLRANEPRIAAETAEREMRPERDGAADFDASRQVERDLADDLDLEADIEENLSVVEQMRQDGRLTRADEEAIADVDRFAEKARAYGDTARAAAACLSS